MEEAAVVVEEVVEEENNSAQHSSPRMFSGSTKQRKNDNLINHSILYKSKMAKIIESDKQFEEIVYQRTDDKVVRRSLVHKYQIFVDFFATW